MKLYHYWRSSSSWRVRWALEYKSIACELIPINLVSGESESPEHLHRHPRGAVPVLELSDGKTLIESLAIIDYLEHAFPDRPSIYLKDPWEQAHCLALSELINSGIHPLQNPTVTAFLGESFSLNPDQQKAWTQHWIRDGLVAFETLLPKPSSFSIGSHLTLADLCLIPQLYNARRYDVRLDDLPKILQIEKSLLKLESCQRSHPDQYKPV